MPQPPAPAPSAPAIGASPSTRPLRPLLGLSLSDTTLLNNPIELGPGSVGIAERGPRIAGIVGGSPAAAAGLKVDERVFRVGGRSIETVADFEAELANRGAPGEVTLRVGRTKSDSHDVKLVVP